MNYSHFELEKVYNIARIISWVTLKQKQQADKNAMASGGVYTEK